MFVVNKPYLFNKDLFLERVNTILDSGVWGNGGYFQTFLENHISEKLGCQYTLAVSNATIGLMMSAKAMGGKRCLMPSFTFSAAAGACRWLDIDIVYGDIDKYYGLDAKEIYSRKEFDFVMPANLFGNVCNSLVMNNPYPTIFDNAHAMGVIGDNGYVGSKETISVFSGHPLKFCGGSEIGVITCNDRDLAGKIKEIRNFGFMLNSGAREGELGSSGINGKCSEIAAAMYLTQLEYMEEIREHYKTIHQTYEKLLPNIIKRKNAGVSNYSYVVCETANRDRVIQKLNDRGVYPRTYFTPLHTTKPYKDKINLPCTMRISSDIITLPTGLTINVSDVEYICRIINGVLKNG